MHKRKVSRRDFLKLSAIGLSGIALPAFKLSPSDTIETEYSEKLARIAIASVSVYSQPWDQSRILLQHYRDEIIHLYYKVIADQGP